MGSSPLLALRLQGPGDQEGAASVSPGGPPAVSQQGRLPRLLGVVNTFRQLRSMFAKGLLAVVQVCSHIHSRPLFSLLLSYFKM